MAYIGNSDTPTLGTQTLFIPAGAMFATTTNGCSVVTTVETTSGRPDMNVLEIMEFRNNYL